MPSKLQKAEKATAQSVGTSSTSAQLLVDANNSNRVEMTLHELQSIRDRVEQSSSIQRLIDMFIEKIKYKRDHQNTNRLTFTSDNLYEGKYQFSVNEFDVSLNAKQKFQFMLGRNGSEKTTYTYDSLGEIGRTAADHLMIKFRVRTPKLTSTIIYFDEKLHKA